MDLLRKRTYQCYQDMKSRCYNKNIRNYPNYGARGIVVCDRWLSSFNNFLEDMGLKQDGLTLERIDVNGNYEQSNCRWATTKEQNSNRRNNHYITIDGITKTLRQWSQAHGINECTVFCRINKGIEPKIALLMKPNYKSRVDKYAAMIESKT